MCTLSTQVDNFLLDRSGGAYFQKLQISKSKENFSSIIKNWQLVTLPIITTITMLLQLQQNIYHYFSLQSFFLISCLIGKMQFALSWKAPLLFVLFQTSCCKHAIFLNVVEIMTLGNTWVFVGVYWKYLWKKAYQKTYFTFFWSFVWWLPHPKGGLFGRDVNIFQPIFLANWPNWK